MTSIRNTDFDKGIVLDELASTPSTEQVAKLAEITSRSSPDRSQGAPRGRGMRREAPPHAGPGRCERSPAAEFVVEELGHDAAVVFTAKLAKEDLSVFVAALHELIDKPAAAMTLLPPATDSKSGTPTATAGNNAGVPADASDVEGIATEVADPARAIGTDTAEPGDDDPPEAVDEVNGPEQPVVASGVADCVETIPDAEPSEPVVVAAVVVAMPDQEAPTVEPHEPSGRVSRLQGPKPRDAAAALRVPTAQLAIQSGLEIETSDTQRGTAEPTKTGADAIVASEPVVTAVTEAAAGIEPPDAATISAEVADPPRTIGAAATQPSDVAPTGAIDEMIGLEGPDRVLEVPPHTDSPAVDPPAMPRASNWRDIHDEPVKGSYCRECKGRSWWSDERGWSCGGCFDQRTRSRDGRTVRTWMRT